LVHRRHKPDHAQVIGERGGRGDRLAIDPALPRARGAFRSRRLDAGPERGKPEHAFDLGGYRPGAVALGESDLFQGGAAQAAARHQKRHCLDQVGLAGAIGAGQHDEIGGGFEVRRVVAAEIAQRQAADRSGGHGSMLLAAMAGLVPGHPHRLLLQE